MNREALATAIDRADRLPAIALDTRIARWFLAVVERVYEGPSSVTPDLRAALEAAQRVKAVAIENGGRLTPGAILDTQTVIAALASVTPSEPTQGRAFGLYIPADTTGITIDGLATTSFEPGSIRSTRRDAVEPDV